MEKTFNPGDRMVIAAMAAILIVGFILGGVFGAISTSNQCLEHIVLMQNQIYELNNTRWVNCNQTAFGAFNTTVPCDKYRLENGFLYCDIR